MDFTDERVIAVPVALFRGADCQMVLFGNIPQNKIPPVLTTACRCVLTATVFDGVSTYLSFSSGLTQITVDDNSDLGHSWVEEPTLNRADLKRQFQSILPF